MPSTAHRQSQQLAEQAASSLRSGNVDSARSLYAQAAESERLALADVPVEKRRTRGVLAVSLVSLLYKTEAYLEAEHEARKWLERGDLPDFAHQQLRELADVARAETHGRRPEGPTLERPSHATARRVHRSGTQRIAPSPTMDYWTHASVLSYTPDRDPIHTITAQAKDVVLSAIERGWNGPPFDPFQLAELLGIPVSPRQDILDAQTVPAGSRGVRIEFNPEQSRGRMRFSVAHEIAHTLFPDCAEMVRNRVQTREVPEDDWQLELLCNIAAAEFLMPIGTGVDFERESMNIDNLLRLRKDYDVSTEALLLRVVRLTDQPCLVFSAARVLPVEDVADYRVDYSFASRSMLFRIPQGLHIRGKTILAECTAVDFTAKGSERWASEIPGVYVECVGLPPYPGHRFPRVAGVAQVQGRRSSTEALQVKYLWGDATDPRGPGHRVIAHIVNDRTPNWGAGFALEVRRKWRPVQDEFKRCVASDRSRLSLGNVYHSRISRGLSIVHMVAQHGYGPSPTPRIRYTALKACLDQLAEVAVDSNASVHMPRIGTGQAGGSWAIIRELIEEAIVSRGVDVTVYNRPGDDIPRELQGVLGLFSMPEDTAQR